MFPSAFKTSFTSPLLKKGNVQANFTITPELSKVITDDSTAPSVLTPEGVRRVTSLLSKIGLKAYNRGGYNNSGEVMVYTKDDKIIAGINSIAYGPNHTRSEVQVKPRASEDILNKHFADVVAVASALSKGATGGKRRSKTSKKKKGSRKTLRHSR